MLTPEVQLAYQDNESIENLYAEHIFLHCFIYVNIYRHDPDTEVETMLLCCSASPANPLFHFSLQGPLCIENTLFE